MKPRIATLDCESVYVAAGNNAMRETQPLRVDLMPDPLERPYVRPATIGAVGGIFNARSEARFWALLTNRGAIGGARQRYDVFPRATARL